MVRVITYGTFDLFHEGHYNLLKQAKALGDYLIVGITSENFDRNRGKFNVQNSLMKRVKDVEATGFADEIIIEEYVGQKIEDIQRLNVDVFTVGSDWVGHFDYLNKYCKVIYSKRTEGISSTQLRESEVLSLGILGNEEILKRFLTESNYVSGINISGILKTNDMYDTYGLKELTFDELWKNSDVIYINAPLQMRADYIKEALNRGKHVITEFPFSPSLEITQKLISLAEKKNVVLMEGLKTAYCPGFLKLVMLVQSGVLGKILHVDATFTQILEESINYQIKLAGGSMNSLGAYPILAIGKILGYDFEDVKFTSFMKNGVDIFTKADFSYPLATASLKVAIEAKSEGELVITGTKGCLYVPAPWWKTEYFEVRYEDVNKSRKYFYKFEEEGLRYELVEFIKLVKGKTKKNLYLTKSDMIFEGKILGLYNAGKFSRYIEVKNA